MTNFRIAFSHPWLLLLILPALGLTLLTYFLLFKKYRKTRNRIISMVLHMIVMVLCISVLAGISFPYELENNKNEIILLIDVSETQLDREIERDEFVEDILRETSYDGFKVGVVTFGFDQVYAVPLTSDVGSVYEAYVAAAEPDTSATDIAAALRYTSTLFNYPETAKIVLISDGMETDESAAEAVRSVSSLGIKVDTALITSQYFDDGLQVVGIERPDSNIIVGEECTIGVNVYSDEPVGEAVIELYNYTVSDTPLGSTAAPLTGGSQAFTFPVTFEEQGLHKLCAKISSEGMDGNNVYFSYIYLTVHDKVLLLEQREGDSVSLLPILEEDYGDGVTKLNLNADLERLPATVEALRAYDQVILNNVAAQDLPAGFQDLLYSYVFTYGGGLFTTGGDDGNGNAHAYDPADLSNYGKTLQEMLPVQAVEYTPPVGVVLVFDISGSMDDAKKQAAVDAAVSVITNNVLNDRDYIGIMTLEQTYGTALQLTPNTRDNRDYILSAINSIKDKDGGGTYFVPSIVHAAQALNAEKNINKRHIVLVTDGMPADNEVARSYAANWPGITLSVVGIQLDSSAVSAMDDLTKDWGGKVHNTQGGVDMMDSLRNDLNAPIIKGYTPKPFYPIIADRLSPVVKGVTYGGVEGESPYALPVELGGYYGTRARSSADVIVEGEYEVPLYAQWQFGAGKVGSFMCDLYGVWSGDLLADVNGQTLLRNIVANLMPSEDIRPTTITLNLREDNYTNTLSIFHDEFKNGETIVGEITYQPESGAPVTVSLNDPDVDERVPILIKLNLSAESKFSRCEFILKGSGTYTITAQLVASDGTVRETVQCFKTFSYSEEYDKLYDKDGAALLAELAQKGKGSQIPMDAPDTVLTGFVTAIAREFDPALAFIITAMVLFLLDIAVRKFKFKWIHEIVRERRERKEEGVR